MAFVTFDPGRIKLLDRALHELSEKLDRYTRWQAPEDMTHLLVTARNLVDEQVARVEASLHTIRSIDSRPRNRLCVDRAVTAYQEWARAKSHWWTQATTDESTRSDEILRTSVCLEDPIAAGRLIDSLPDIQLMILGTADLGLVEDLWRSATDPSTTSSSSAGARIRRLLEVVFDPRPWEHGIAGGSIDPVERARRNLEIREIAARIVAPWQLHLSRPDSPWSWSGTEGVRRLHQLSNLESASDTLVRGLADALRRSLSVLPEDPFLRLQQIDAVASAVGASLEVRLMSEVDRARATSDLDTLRQVLGTLALDGPWPISMIVDAGAHWVGDYFDTSDTRVREATLENLLHREVLASIAVLAVFSSSIRRPRRPNSHTPDVHPPSPAQLSTELRHTYQSIDNAAAHGQSLARLASPG